MLIFFRADPRGNAHIRALRPLRSLATRGLEGVSRRRARPWPQGIRSHIGRTLTSLTNTEARSPPRRQSRGSFGLKRRAASCVQRRLRAPICTRSNAAVRRSRATRGLLRRQGPQPHPTRATGGTRRRRQDRLYRAAQRAVGRLALWELSRAPRAFAWGVERASTTREPRRPRSCREKGKGRPRVVKGAENCVEPRPSSEAFLKFPLAAVLVNGSYTI